MENVEWGYSVTLDPLPQQTKEWNRVHLFYSHLREGRLTTTGCRECGGVSWPPRSICPDCFSDDPDWVDLPTTARVLAFTVQEAGVPPGFTPPLVFALLEFTPQVRFIGRVLIDDPAALAPGASVELVVQAVPGDRVLPAFRPAIAEPAQA